MGNRLLAMTIQYADLCPTQTSPDNVQNLSSKWALHDHLEYCADDKLSELDGYDEHLKEGTVNT